MGPNKIGNVCCAFIFSALLSENLFCKMCLVSSILPDGFLSEAVCQVGEEKGEIDQEGRTGRATAGPRAGDIAGTASGRAGQGDGT